MKKIIYIVILIPVFLLLLFISYKVNLNNLPSSFINILEYKYKKSNLNINIDIIPLVINNYKYKTKFIKKKDEIKDNKTVLYTPNNPIVYIYNTHTNEEYSYNKSNLYNIVPTVKTASYILQNELSNLGIDSIVEENNVTNTVNERNLTYAKSYKVSREFLENKKLEYPSLIYFIDIHRYSVKRSITTANIDNKNYAKTMFLLGLENEKYKENQKVMNTLNSFLESNYKGLSRGIYEKSGYGVNGVYNQDFDKNVMLIEVGGYENTIEEVSNSLKVIANMLKNYIIDNKSTNID